MNKFGVGFAVGAVVSLLAAAALWLTVAYSGAYNVAASDNHADAVRWTFDTAMHRSVARRAGGARAPEGFSADAIARGAGHYAQSCAHCHGAPGQDPAQWSRGMRPEPPHLNEAAGEWTPEEIRWIITHGVKMTGMPSFAERHTAGEITALTAFVTELPGLTKDDYARLRSANEESAAQE